MENMKSIKNSTKNHIKKCIKMKKKDKNLMTNKKNCIKMTKKKK